ncbi:MAG: hypothetical protein JNM72_11390 [Deltaproteobacteria bacterium]|nr:hypothetical protein [Deltaproteobacteria bacterium]
MAAHQRHNDLNSMTKASIARRMDAEQLFAAQRWAGAMYMAGYFVECALKASLMECFHVADLGQLNAELTRRTHTQVETTTHSLTILIELHPELQRRRRAPLLPRNQPLIAALRVVAPWSSTWRYSPVLRTAADAGQFMAALDPISAALR